MKRTAFSRFLSDYGMIFVLFLLCAYYSVATLEEQHPAGAAAGGQVAARILREHGKQARVAAVARQSQEDQEFVSALRKEIEKAGGQMAGVVQGGPADARQEIERLARESQKVDAIACNSATVKWAVFDQFAVKYPGLARTKIHSPESYRWPNFLKTGNLLNVANQIAVIAIIAIGMTMVIITAGIDLSVGSLIALAAVACTLVIQNYMGGAEAGPGGMVLASLVGILACGAVGFVSGVMVTIFGIPAFIATLAMMLVASGLAFIFAKGQSIYQVPETFIWLGRGADLGIPNAVILMLFLYVAAHILMTRTPLGRYIYAVGGNQEAARLSGVPVKRVLLFVYAVSGLLAGLGGIIMASQLKSGAPTYGQMYELYVIAAVVVGGTSLGGGEGKILGTLIGALIIAVIQNGMNLTGVESYTQKVVLGLVILGAVLLDMLKRRSGGILRFRRKTVAPS